MRIRTLSAALAALALVASSCSENNPAGPTVRGVFRTESITGPDAGSTVVISQVYGGGGNAGATLKNDFVELHNRGSEVVSLVGWSVQYASSTGAFSTSNLTSITQGSIAPGGYFLVQESAGTGGTVSLPTPDASGGIAMSGTGGKVALVNNSSALTCTTGAPTCTSAALMDLVGYGNATGFEGSAATPALTNTTAALRGGNGCTDTNNNGADFTTGSPAPRNSASTAVSCTVVAPAEVDHVTVSPTEATVQMGGTLAFTAKAFDVANNQVTGAFTWSLDPASSAVASIDPSTGVATALTVGDVGIIATTSGKADTATLHVTAAAVLPETRFSEIHYDPLGTDVGEAIEIEGPAGTNLQGWDIVLYNGNGGAAYSTVHLSGVIPATCGARGVVVTTYPQDGIQNGSPDGFALVNTTTSTVVQFLSYEGSFAATDGPAIGLTSADLGVGETSDGADQSLQLISGEWKGPIAASFGACNGTGGGPVGGKSISFTGRLATDPALPVGFEDQLFATLHDGSTTVPSTFTWASATPDIASIDANGVMHALTAGTATFVATAADGTTANYSLPTIVAGLGGTADYTGNTAFGIPTDGDASDDFIITRDQYTISYSPTRNTPNWVSYEFDASHFQQTGQNIDRCDCFTHDPALPTSFTHLTTANYTGASDFAPGQIDRGHMARSFDFTSGALDNARSYYFSNIVPQFADLNQGPWAILENYLGDKARSGGKEVYIIDGPAGSRGTVKNEGKIVIPSFTWKVALVLPLNHGLADIHDYRDIDEVVAVIMPNQPGVRNVDWNTYKKTVADVEAISGYNLFTSLPVKVRGAVESGTKPPISVVNGPYESAEGSAVSLSGAASFDGDGTIVGYSWSFGDGQSGSGPSVSHTYAQDGSYPVRLIVTDNLGIADTSFTTANVSNVAPLISTFPGATLLPGETYSAEGSFTDPGSDPWSATVNYGDGTGSSTLPLSGKAFSLAHVYNVPATYQVEVRVSDDDVTSSRKQFVTVITPLQGLAPAAGMIQELVSDGRINSGNGNSLSSKLDAAQRQLTQGGSIPAANQLSALLNEIDAMVRSGRLSAADAAPLRALVGRVISSLSI
jgi:DNA/RNA endonuclease G (NUC1)